jgi:hypothetical protein
LLVEVSLILLLSVRMAVERAAAVIYGVWATVLFGLTWGLGADPPTAGLSLDLLLSGLGLATIAVAVRVVCGALARRSSAQLLAA